MAEIQVDLAQDFLFSQMSFLTYFHCSFIVEQQKFGMMATMVDREDENNAMPFCGCKSSAGVCVCMLELLTEVGGPELEPGMMGCA